MSSQIQGGMRQSNLVGLAFDTLFVILVALWVCGFSGFWFDLVALGFICFWGAYEAVGRTRVFFLNIHSYLFGILFLLGVFAIEYSSGFYLYEIAEVSGWANTFFGALACMYAYLRAASMVLSSKVDARQQGHGRRPAFFYLIVIFYLFLSFGVVAYFKPALVLQVDRFIYDKSVLGIWGNITNLGYYLCLGLGMVFFCRRSKYAFFLFILVVLVFLLKGHKFANLIEATFLFMLPYFSLTAVSVLRRRIFSIFSGIGFFLFLAVSINLYLFPSFSPVEYLKTRLSQEGQLWWGIAKNDEYKLFHLDEWREEFSTYFSEERMEKYAYEIGMYKVMRLTTPHEVVESKLERFSRYTRSTQALLLYYFNYFMAFVLMVIFGGIWGLLLKRMYLAVLNFRLLESILLCRLFYILMKAFKDGDLYKVFSLEMLLIMFSIFVLGKFYDRFSGALRGAREYTLNGCK